MKKLKKLFKEFNIDGYIVPKNNEYFNEYIHSSEDRLKFISNFSGSAGFAVVLRDKNYLFVDGRYTVQARYQSGEKFKIITIPKKFPKNTLKVKKKTIIGFDPKLHTFKQLNFLFNIKNVKLKPINQNLIDLIWKGKAKHLTKAFFKLTKKEAGKTTFEKLRQVKRILVSNDTDYLFVTAPENIAWILNIRGQDSSYSPIPNSRLLIDKNGKMDLFANTKKIKKIKKNIKKIITLHDEKNINDLLKYIYTKKIWIDSSTCSIYFKNLLIKNNVVIEKIDPIYFLKSIKNKTEINNMKKIHIADGVALTKFLFWLKKNFRKTKITELSAQEKLENFRKKNPKYRFPSFNTISGSGPNSAIIHYKASKKTNRPLKLGDIYLVDSGGQYSFGTTDVTRTISLANTSKYIKEIYTRVLKGHIAVSNFRVNKNSTGSQVDRNARKFLNKINLDYPHGTGHGVGYFLNVHEGPQSFSKNNKVKLKDGMILSNEPGYYKEGFFGVRIENLIYINKNKFEELTLAPLEKELVQRKMLNKIEINWINNYHKKVQKKLYRFMDHKEKLQLTKACSPI